MEGADLPPPLSPSTILRMVPLPLRGRNEGQAASSTLDFFGLSGLPDFFPALAAFFASRSAFFAALASALALSGAASAAPARAARS